MYDIDQLFDYCLYFNIYIIFNLSLNFLYWFLYCCSPEVYLIDNLNKDNKFPAQQ